MKGVKLLFTALLCLFTSGARAQYVYDTTVSGYTDNFTLTESSGSATIGGNQWYPYTRILVDKNRGLAYFIPADGDNIYIGLATYYKWEDGDPKTSVNIPNIITIKTSSGTETKNVTTIIDYGFTNGNNEYNTTQNNGDIPGYTYYYPSGSAHGTSKSIAPLASRKHYYNPKLKEVTFTTPSNITWIGIGAFQGCTALKSIVIPNSVTKLDREAFTYCTGLKTVEFQKFDEPDANGKEVGFTYLPYNCFYQCNALESLDVPEGVDSIGRFALQDCWSLKEISLPSTLKHIGDHFLCRALSLTSFYLPASVEDIDAAFLHGCENMRHVYLMGDAAVLESGTGTSKSFYGESTTASPDVYGVNNCTFHVMAAFKNNYTTSSNTWYDVWDGGTGNPNPDVPTWGYQGSTETSATLAVEGRPSYNRIVWPSTDHPEQYQKDFGPYKWQSVIFYEGMTQAKFKEEFGEDALIANFVGCTKDSQDSKHYSFWFETFNSEIKGKTPYMIYVGDKTVKHDMYDLNKANETEDFRTFYTKRYNVSVPVKVNGTATGEKAVMVGLAVPIPLSAGDFTFQWVANADHTQSYGQFRGARVTGQSGSKGRYSCLWNITDNGTKLAGQEVQVSSAKRFMPAITGIKGVEAEQQPTFDINIYDLSGRLVGTSRSDLPKGMYIQGGKKFIKK